MHTTHIPSLAMQETTVTIYSLWESALFIWRWVSGFSSLTLILLLWYYSFLIRLTHHSLFFPVKAVWLSEKAPDELTQKFQAIYLVYFNSRCYPCLLHYSVQVDRLVLPPIINFIEPCLDIRKSFRLRSLDLFSNISGQFLSTPILFN